MVARAREWSVPARMAGLCAALSAWSPGAGAAPMQDVLAPAGIQAEHILALWHVTLAVRTAVFVAVLLGLAIADVVTDRPLSRLPMEYPLHVGMIGHRWWWKTRYERDGDRPGFVTANQLRLPVGRPVIVSLKAADVIHTFWIPHLHGKRDMIPGREADITLRADRAGEYRGQCAEFCGAEHALMAFPVVADTPQDYAARRRRMGRLRRTCLPSTPS
ncbi:hypothetical protein [Bordetella flabilis]|nr:hypothetical protein [Bordetella flabilis]